MANEQLLTIIISILTATIALGGLILAQSRVLRNRLGRIAGDGAYKTPPRISSAMGGGGASENIFTPTYWSRAAACASGSLKSETTDSCGEPDARGLTIVN